MTICVVSLTVILCLTCAACGAFGGGAVGIASIEKTGTEGLVDTYTITMTDGSTSTFTVTNGSSGSSAGGGAAGASDCLYYTILADDTYEVVARYFDMPSRVVIPSSYNGKPVTRIGRFSTSEEDECPNRTVEEIVLPNTIKEIDDHAFYYYTALKSISIPSSVERIGDYAFGGCDNLTYNEYGNAYYLGDQENPYTCLVKGKDREVSDISIHSATKYIYHNAFRKFNNLTSVTIPDGVKGIGSYSFEYCNNLTFLTIPDSVSYVGDAFYGCENLTYNEQGNALYLGNASNPYLVLMKAKDQSITSVSINNKTKIIHENAFRFCPELTSVVIPSSVTSIGEYAFYYCTKLTEITIPSGVTKIENSTFSRCSALTSITIPNTVVEIGSYVIESCKALTSINYQGTKAQWKDMIISEYWDGENGDRSAGDYVIHCTDGDIEKA